METKDRPHPLFATLVEFAAQGSISAPITLQMHGLVVSGTLTSASAHLKGLRDQLSASGGFGSSMANALQNFQDTLEQQPSDDSDSDDRPFIYLQDVTIWIGNTTMKAPWWVGDIRAVDGWILGSESGH